MDHFGDFDPSSTPYMKAWRSSKFGQILPLTTELAALELKKKIPYTYNGENVVATFSRMFLIGSFLFLQVMITHIRAWMSSKLFQI